MQTSKRLRLLQNEMQTLESRNYPLSCHGKWGVEPLFEGAAALEDGG